MLKAFGIGVLILAGIMVVYVERGTKAVAFFSTALARASINETVVVNNISYTVTKGNVVRDGKEVTGIRSLPIVRLAYAKTLATRNPLLAIAGTDPEQLRDALHELTATRAALADVQSNERVAGFVKSSLYPIDYLQSMADVEMYRLAFVASGRDDDEARYRQAQHSAATSLLNDLRKFEKSFRIAVPNNAKAYAMANEIVTYEKVLTSIEEIERGILETTQKLHIRAHCLRGFVSRCNTEDLRLPQLSLSPSIPLSRAEKEQARRSAQMLTTAINRKADGPLVVAGDACNGTHTAPPVYIPLARPTDDSGRFARVELVGDMRFIKSDASDTPFIRYFAAQGLHYVPHSVMSYYRCSDADTLQKEVYGVLEVSKFIDRTPLSVFARGETQDRLVALESRLVSTNEFITKDDAVRYLTEAVQLLETAALPKEIENELVSLILQFHTNSTQFDSVINDIVWSENSNVRLLDDNVGIELAGEYLFYVRSAFPALFLTDNPSIMGTSLLSMQKNSIPEDEQPFVWLSSLPRSAATESTLIRDMHYFYVIHE